MKKQNGITLIALVITIIVLLILAGVSINAIVGNNGILNKSTEAVESNKNAQLEEKILTAWAAVTMDYSVDFATKNNIKKEEYFTKERLNAVISDGEIVKISFVDNGTTILSYKENSTKKTYSVSINQDGELDIINYSEEGTLASIITPENYSQKINYSINEVNDWRIFYNDGANVFLISTNYVPNNLLNVEALGAEKSGEYNIYWNTVPEMQDISKKNIFRSNFNFSNLNSNARCISTLLNTNNWQDFVDTDYADYAVGGASVEMWMASWNEKYPTEKLYYNNGSEYGYWVGVNPNPTSYYIQPEELNQMQGYLEAAENNLYYPYKTDEITRSYWLTSPANGSENGNYILNISCYPYVDNNSYNNEYRAIRPVVRLKSDVKATQNEDGTWTLESK